MVDALGEEYQYNLCDGVMTWAGAGNASPSGRWLAGTFCTETLSEDRREVYTSYCPAFFNTETKTTVIFDELGGFGGSAVTDDGIGFVGSTDGMASCREYGRPALRFIGGVGACRIRYRHPRRGVDVYLPGRQVLHGNQPDDGYRRGREHILVRGRPERAVT